MLKKITLTICFAIISLLVAAQVPVANFTADITRGCGTTVITFSDHSTNNPTSWLWDFGDGSAPSTLRNPAHTYQNTGIFTVTLTATNASGSNSRIRNAYITILGPPNANFIADRVIGCAPQVIRFTDLSNSGSIGIASWLWDFGDGYSSSDQMPTHTYNAEGIYNVSLMVTDSNSCSKQIYRANYIRIDNYPVTSFTSNNPTSCTAPYTVNFINSSIGNNLTFRWNFGDGTPTSNIANPSHSYSINGSYNVTLISSTLSGCTDTVINNNFVNIASANFNATSTTGCPPFDVTFNNTSSSSDTAWYWIFSDGGTSNLRDPIHTYANSGIYTVTLTVYFRGGCSNTKTINSYIRVNSLPIVSFSANDTAYCKTPFNVTFTNTTTGSSTVQWAFGDGGTSTLSPTILHSYTTLGQYSVTLAVTNSSGCTGSLTKPNYIKIEKPIARFMSDKVLGCKPLIANFTNQSVSSSAITLYSWNFGDPISGANNVSSLQNPQHIFNPSTDTATFSIKFKITNADGCIDSSYFNYIKTGIQHPPKFYSDDSSGCHKFTVNFRDTTLGFVDSWRWTFGDGQSSILQHPEHEYSDTIGYFPVQLITESYGCADTLRIDSFIRVFPPQPKFDADILSACFAPMNVVFTDRSNGATSWFWDFGDGITSNFQSPAHIYNSSGYYTVKLRVTNGNGCVDSLIKTNYIKIAEDHPYFSSSSLSICKNQSVTYNDTSSSNTYITNWKWDFGDGIVTNTVVNNAQTHTYILAGLYSIKLVITDQLGCKDSIIKINHITVNELPTVNFGSDTTYGCRPLLVQFSDSSQAVIGSVLRRWHWQFGTNISSDTSSLRNPSFTYLHPNNYDVSLTVTDSRNCSNTLIKPDFINPTYPVPKFTTPNVVCYNNRVIFNNTSVGSSLSYSWNFGDGSAISHAVSPQHNYTVTATRNFNVQLTAIDINGCDSTITKPITISRPVLEFSADTANLSFCPPLFVPFTDLSSLDVISWKWIFGDTISGSANSSVIQDALHVYNNLGVFDVTLIATNNYGCVDSLIKPGYIKIQGPYANPFTINPVSGCSPLNVLFNANNPQHTAHMRWVFGDGAVSTVNPANHIFNIGGSYLSALELEDSLGCKVTILATEIIKVISADVNFGVDTNFSCGAQSFQFYDSTIANGGNISSWSWNFGDGGNSTLQNPEHTYTLPGDYDVTLTVTIDTCESSYTQTEYIHIYSPPLLSFTAQDTTGCDPLEVHFSVAQTSAADSVLNWQWNYNDGTFSTERNPSRYYDSSGTYNIIITATFLNGCVVDYSRDFLITVYPRPNANFYYDSTDIFADKPIIFTDSSSGDIASYVWNFGDESGSREKSPTHTFDYMGENTNPVTVIDYTVTLIVMSTQGCIDTTTRIINLPERKIEYNAFSPDGDGTNDKFGENLNIVVMNRWGQTLYEGTEGWDGTFNGQKASQGTYYYIIKIDEIKGNEAKVIKGALTLLRKNK